MNWVEIAADGLPPADAPEDTVYAVYFAPLRTYAVAEYRPETEWFYPHSHEVDLVFSQQPTHYAVLEAPL